MTRRSTMRAGATSVGRAIFDQLALGLFQPWAGFHGYRFVAATTLQQNADAERVKLAVYGAAGCAPLPELAEWAKKYDRAAHAFVAYYRGRPIGTLSLLNSSVASVVLDLVPSQLPPDVELSRVWEIGRVAVEPSSRGRSHFVLIGLLRAMYLFSRRHGVRHWLACSAPTVFRLARSFNPSARPLPEDPSGVPDPTALLYASGYLETLGAKPVVYLMDADGFAPWAVFRRHLEDWVSSRRRQRIWTTARNCPS